MLAVSLLALPASAQSLGQELILSRLGDPVEVEIAITDWQRLELDRLEISNATREQYAAFKVDYLPVLDSLNLNVIGPNRSGEVKVLVSSRAPLHEPYLDLLLVLKWPEGSSLREYVLLFDPPLDSGGTDKPVNGVKAVAQPKADPGLAVRDPAPAVQGNAAAPRPGNVPDVRTQPPIPVESTASGKEPAPVTDGRRQYRVRDNDSLWNIARQFHPAGIGENLYQFLISLHELNRGAFINGNISMLKADALLRIPTARDIATINPGSAQKQFERMWREGTSSPDFAATGHSPDFQPINEPPDKPTPAKAPEPKLPPGTERSQVTAQQEGVLVPAGNLVSAKPGEPAIAAQTGAGVVSKDQSPPPVTVVPERVTAASSPAKAKTDANPYLQKITESAVTIRDLLETRRQRLLALEEQIVQMQAQMQKAQQRAQELDVEQSGVRERRQADNTRKAALLGLAVATMLIALAVIVRFAWQWNLEAKRLAWLNNR